MVRIVLSDRYYYIYVLYEWAMLLRYRWRKRGSLFRPSYACDKRFVLHVAYIYLRVINAPTTFRYFTYTYIETVFIYFPLLSLRASRYYIISSYLIIEYSFFSFESYTIFFIGHCHSRSIQFYKTQYKKSLFNLVSLDSCIYNLIIAFRERIHLWWEFVKNPAFIYSQNLFP